MIPFGLLVVPEIERLETSKAISQKLLSWMKPDERLGAESNYLAGLAFYTDKIPMDLDKHDLVVQFLNSSDRVWAVQKEKNHRNLYNDVINPEYVKPSYMVYKSGKRVIATNKLPENGRYILKRERPQ